MKVRFTSSFNKDVSTIPYAKLVDAVNEAIENAKQAKSPIEIRNIKKLKGYKNHYRIRIGNYRIGLFFEGGILEFSRFLHRKAIYRYFP